MPGGSLGGDIPSALDGKKLPLIQNDDISHVDKLAQKEKLLLCEVKKRLDFYARRSLNSVSKLVLESLWKANLLIRFKLRRA